MENLTNEYPIRRIKILREVFGNFIFLFIVAVVLFNIIKWQGHTAVGLLNNADSVLVPSLITLGVLLLIILNAVYEALYISSFKYFTDGSSITIAKGVISKHEITLPFSRITDLYVDQSMMDRVFGLYDLHFSTPTATSGSAAHIAGLNKSDCDALRRRMLDSVYKMSGPRDK